MSTLRLALRQVLTDRVAVATVAAIVAVCAGLAAALPRAMDAMVTDGLRQAITEATPAQRDIVVRSLAGAPMADGDDPLRPTRVLLDELKASLPGPLRALTGDPTFLASYTDFPMTSLAPVRQPPKGLAQWDVDLPGDIDRHVRYVDGRPPASITTTPLPGAPTGPAGGFAEVPPLSERSVVEVAVSARTAADIGLAPGSTVDLQGNLDLLVVGVFEPLDPGDLYWGWQAQVLRPPVVVSPAVGDIYQPVAVVAPAAWPGVQRQVAFTKRPSLVLRIPVHAAGVQASQAMRLLSLVRQVESTPRHGPPSTDDQRTFVPVLEDFRLLTNLDVVLAGHLRAQASSTALVSLLVSGLLGVALAVLALAARLVVERRRRTLALAVARGASPVQVATLMSLEGLLLGLPAAALGYLAAGALVDGWSGVWGVALPLVLGLAPAVLLPALARPGGLRVVRRDITGANARRWRLAGELLVGALALGTLVLVRRRGLVGGGFDVAGAGARPGDLLTVPQVGVDPLLAAAPVLLGLALALLLVRWYPRPVAALAAAARRRRDAVPFLGAARAGRDATGGTLPLVVLLLALATSVFGAVVASTSDAGSSAAAWRSVGADARISANGFADSELADAAAVPGVRALAGLSTTVATAVGQRRTVDVTLAGTDAEAFTDVQRDVPGAVPLRPALTTPRADDDRVPVLASPDLGEVGTELTLQVAGRSTPAVVVATARAVPSLVTARPFVIADLAALRTAGADLPVPDVALVALEDGVDTAALGARLQEVLGTAAPLVTQDEAVQRARRQPLVAGTLGAFPLASGVAAALSGLAVVLTLVVSAPDRTRLLSRLRTLGLSQRQARWLVVWEVAPLAVAALVAGAVTGLVAAWWLTPVIDLRAFTGGARQPALSVDVPAVLAIAGAFALVTALFLAVAVAANRRLRLGAVLRVGDES